MIHIRRSTFSSPCVLILSLNPSFCFSLSLVSVSLSSLFMSRLAHHCVCSVPISVSLSFLTRSAFVFCFSLLKSHFYPSQSDLDDANVSVANDSGLFQGFPWASLSSFSYLSVALKFTHTQTLIHPQVFFFLPLTLNKAVEVSELKRSKTNYWHSTGDIPKGSVLFDTQSISFLLLHDWQRRCLITQECLEAPG